MVVAEIPSTNSGQYNSKGPNMSSIAQSSSTSMLSRVGEPSSECHCELAMEIEITQTKLRGLSKRQSIINKLYDNEDMRECMKEVPGVERIRQLWSTDRSNLEITFESQLRTLKESASRYSGEGQAVFSQLCADRQKAQCARAFECMEAIPYKMLGPENMETKSSGNAQDIDDKGGYSCNKADDDESADEEQSKEAEQLDQRGEDFEDEEDNKFMEAERSERRDNRGVKDEDEQNILILGEVQIGAKDERSDGERAFECIKATIRNEPVLKNTQSAAGDSDDGMGEQSTEYEDQDTRTKGAEWNRVREDHNEDQGEHGSEAEGSRRDGCVEDWGKEQDIRSLGREEREDPGVEGEEGAEDIELVHDTASGPDDTSTEKHEGEEDENYEDYGRNRHSFKGPTVSQTRKSICTNTRSKMSVILIPSNQHNYNISSSRIPARKCKFIFYTPQRDTQLPNPVTIISAPGDEDSDFENCKMRRGFFNPAWKDDDRKFTRCMSAYHGIEDLGVVTKELTYSGLLKWIENWKRDNGGRCGLQEAAKKLHVDYWSIYIALHTWIYPFMKMVPQELSGFGCTIPLCPHSRPEHWFQNRNCLVIHMSTFHVCNRRQNTVGRDKLGRSPLLEEAVQNSLKAGESRIFIIGISTLYVSISVGLIFVAKSNLYKARVKDILEFGPQQRFPNMMSCGCCQYIHEEAYFSPLHSKRRRIGTAEDDAYLQGEPEGTVAHDENSHIRIDSHLCQTAPERLEERGTSA